MPAGGLGEADVHVCSCGALSADVNTGGISPPVMRGVIGSENHLSRLGIRRACRASRSTDKLRFRAGWSDCLRTIKGRMQAHRSRVLACRAFVSSGYLRRSRDLVGHSLQISCVIDSCETVQDDTTPQSYQVRPRWWVSPEIGSGGGRSECHPHVNPPSLAAPNKSFTPAVRGRPGP
ncbi:unnamed protein product [Lota lota]